MTRRYAKLTEAEDGWSPWVRSVRGYRLACCDCGLVHDMELRVTIAGAPVDMRTARVAFRVSRNPKATAAMRRKKGGTR